jgi:L-alanine-DL-glutamate epimerase-like enolase superfamily enzyme
MKITAVRCLQVSGAIAVRPLEERQVGMLDVYPDFATRPAAATRPSRATHVFLQIDTNEGIQGLFGAIFPETASLILGMLAPHLLGRDPLATEFLWDLLYRQDRHARKGHEMMAISAVDVALWDIRSKAQNQPIYRLLGGPTRDRIDCYASMLGFSHDPGLVRERAQMAVAEGFKAQKWFFRYGPADGLAGMEKNVALVRTVRDAVGPHVEIMLDAWMGWDASYAVRLLERVAEFRPRWMEEPVPPDRVGDLAAIKRAVKVPIATGEHEYTRWGFLSLLQADAVDVLQSDPDWCGGISELVKICTLASAYGRHAIPHGHSIHAAAHVIAAQSPAVCPMAEFLLLHQAEKQHFYTEYYAPSGGSLALPTAPGLGIALDATKIDEQVEIR